MEENNVATRFSKFVFFTGPVNAFFSKLDWLVPLTNGKDWNQWQKYSLILPLNIFAPSLSSFD